VPKMQNRVQETTTTGGTGTITLAGAVTGYITFAAGFTTGDVLFYTLDNGIGEWEIGIGTLVTTGTLSRTTVIASSNSGALVNFSSGTKRVFCSAPTRSLVPDQDSKSGYVLTTDGTNPSWTQTLNSVNIGNTTAGTGAFTTLSASSTVSGTGFSNYLASPPAIGGSSPAGGAFTTLSASSTVSGTGFSNYLASPPAIGGSSPAAGAFTNLSYTGTLTGGTGVIAIGTNQIYKDASGNVGIGTGSPAAKIQVVGSSSNATATFLSGASGSLCSLNLGRDTRSYTFAIAAAANQFFSGSAAGDSVIAYGTGQLFIGTGNIDTPGTERLRISSTGVVTIGNAISLDPTTANALVVNSSGNVGLGVTPSAWAATNSSAMQLRNVSIAGLGLNDLHASSNAYFDGAAWRYIASGVVASNCYQNAGAHIWRTTNTATGAAGGAISWSTPMTLTAAGNLLVGVAGRTERLAVVGDSGPQAVCFLAGNTAGDAGNSALVISKFDNNQSTSQVFVRFFSNNVGTANGQINGNGASQAAFGTYSDSRLKENIQTLPPQLHNICSLRPVEFDYIASEGGGHQYSFIAQEFEKIYPESVGERDDGMKTITGWGRTEAILVKAIQELHAEIESLKQRTH
jgi:Chaperone of endosialidase